MPVDPDRFRHAMSHLAGAVCVVAVRAGTEGRGMTASSVTSLSLQPPLLLVCVDSEAEIAAAIQEADLFAVSILAADQSDVAIRFADRTRSRFPADGPRTPRGLPLVEGAVAHVECQRAAVLAGGDHLIVTGSVEWSEESERPPLLYFRGHYGTLA